MSVRSLKARILVAAALWIVIALSVGGYAISQVYNTSALRQLDRRLTGQLDLLSVAVARAPDNPDERMTSPEFARVYSGSYWQAENGSSIIHRSRSLWHDNLELPGDQARIIDGPRQQTLRVLTRQLTTPHGQDWRLGVAVDLVNLEQEMQAFRRSLLFAGGILTLVLVVSALLVLRAALKPLAKLRDGVSTGAAEMMPEDFPDEGRRWSLISRKPSIAMHVCASTEECKRLISPMRSKRRQRSCGTGLARLGSAIPWTSTFRKPPSHRLPMLHNLI